MPVSIGIPQHEVYVMQHQAHTAGQQNRLVDREIFRSVIGHFASGVTIITSRYKSIDYGLTASSVCSVSLNPPTLLICVNKTAASQQAIANSGVFAVHILHENQADLARQFATSNPDKFLGVDVTYGALGVPLLNDALATLECRVVEEVTGGTHSVFIAEVETANFTDGMPLTYFRGRMGRFEFINKGKAAPLWKDMQWHE